MDDVREALRSYAEGASIDAGGLGAIRARLVRRKRMRRAGPMAAALLLAGATVALASVVAPGNAPELTGTPEPVASGRAFGHAWTLSLGPTTEGTGVHMHTGIEPGQSTALTVPTFLLAGQCALEPLGSIFFGVSEPTEVAPGVTWGVVTPDIASVTVTTPDGETFEGRMMDLPDGEVPYDAYVVELRSQANGVFSIEARDATGRVVVSGGIRALDNAARPRRSLGKQAPRDVGFRNA